MTITTHRKNLLPALKFCASIVPPKSTIPVLAMLRFAASSGKIDIESSNLEHHLWHSADAETGPDGKLDVLVPARELLALIQSLPDAALEISHKPPYMIIRCGKNKYRLPTDDPANFPKPPEKDDAIAKIGLTQADMETLAGALHAAGNDDLRSTMKAANIHENAGRLAAICTDGHRLAFFPTDVQAPEGLTALAPPETIRMAMAMNAPTITMTLYESSVHFATEKCSLNSQLIAGQYPNWKRVTPKLEAYPIKARIERQALLDSLNRNQLFAERGPQEDFSATQITLAGSTITIETSSDSRGAGKEELAASVEPDAGEPFTILFSAHYLRDGVFAMPGDEITLHLITPNDAAFITSAAAPQAFTLVLPRRIELI